MDELEHRELASVGDRTEPGSGKREAARAARLSTVPDWGALCLLAIAAVSLVRPSLSRDPVFAETIDESVGDFGVSVNDRYESAITYKGKGVVTRESSDLAAPDWSVLFPSKGAKTHLTRSGVPAGRQIVIAADDPGIGNSRKVITVTTRYVDYHLEFNVVPGVEKAHQSQWFVLLAALEGHRYFVLTPTQEKEGVFRSASSPTTLVQEVRHATVPTVAGMMTFDFFDSDTGWHLDDYTTFWAKTYLFYNSKDVDPKLGCRRRVSFRIYPGKYEAPKPRFEVVPFASACTTGFTDEKAGDREGGWTDDGPNDLRQFPVGEQTFLGIPFSIVDPAKNAGKSCIVLRGRAWQGYMPRDYFPESATLPVAEKATTLYFLQTCAWPAVEGQLAARYLVRYEDGSTAEVPLLYGYDLSDWFNIQNGGRCFVAWTSFSAGGVPFGVHVSWWRNPFPEKRIGNLVFRSENTTAVPILLAVTLSDQEPRLWGEPTEAGLDKLDVSGWFRFTFPWCDDESSTATDVSFLLDAPAGKHGFVTARNGHLFFEDGKRAKFWGVNFDRVPCLPHHDNAEHIAAHLAKYGNNLVRLHCLDSFQPTAGNLFDQKFDDSLHLSADNLDRLDYLLAQLKKRGIYVVIDLWGFRRFLPGDGVKDRQAWHAREYTSMQGAVIFDPRLQELEREYARLLLTHRNPYTGLVLKDEPQLALIELFNEVSLLRRWTWSALSPAYTQELAQLWNAWLLEQYHTREGLAQAWTDADGKGSLRSDEDPAKGTVEPFFDLYALGAGKDSPEEKFGDARVNDALRFLCDLEVRHSRGMRDYLRSLGVKVPICSTGDLGETATSAMAAAALDFTDQHTYWQHPSYPGGRTHLCSVGEAETSPFAVPDNEPWTRCPMNNVMRTAAVKTAGLPLINSEWNIPWPNEHRMAGPLFIAAYGSLQDWDGILLYALTPITKLAENAADERWDPMVGVFQFDGDPARAATWQAAAAMFLRGDVQAARRCVTIVHGPKDPFFARHAAIEPSRQPHGPRYAPFRFLPFVSRVESCWDNLSEDKRGDFVLFAGLAAPAKVSSVPRALVLLGNSEADLHDKQRLANVSVGPQQELVRVPSDPNSDPQWLCRAVRQAASAWGIWSENLVREGVLYSDTGQLAWAYDEGYFSVDAPLSQAAAGRLGGREVRLSVLAVRVGTERCAVSATSLDGKPLSRSGRVLLCAAARAQNTDQRSRRFGNWITVLHPGRPPVLAEPVKAEVSLRRDVKAPILKVRSLTPSGKRAQDLPVKYGPRDLSFEIGVEGLSVYYELAP